MEMVDRVGRGVSSVCSGEENTPNTDAKEDLVGPLNFFHIFTENKYTFPI